MSIWKGKIWNFRHNFFGGKTVLMVLKDEGHGWFSEPATGKIYVENTDVEYRKDGIAVRGTNLQFDNMSTCLDPDDVRYDKEGYFVDRRNGRKILEVPSDCQVRVCEIPKGHTWWKNSRNEIAADCLKVLHSPYMGLVPSMPITADDCVIGDEIGAFRAFVNEERDGITLQGKIPIKSRDGNVSHILTEWSGGIGPLTDAENCVKFFLTHAAAELRDKHICTLEHAYTGLMNVGNYGWMVSFVNAILKEYICL